MVYKIGELSKPLGQYIFEASSKTKNARDYFKEFVEFKEN